MKKIASLLVALFALATTASAQSFSNGTGVLSGNVGLGSHGLPIAVSYEQGVYDINSDMSLGVGGIVGINNAHLMLGARGAWHFTSLTNTDLYAGLTLGYNQSVKNEYNSGLLLGAHVGGRYYFNSNFGANLELGYGIAWCSVGVSYKF